MTERGRDGLERDRDHLVIGPSQVRWSDDGITIDLDEVTVPFPGRLRGRVRVIPGAVTSHSVALDANGRHCWWPIAPCARVEVSLSRPDLEWSGDGYLDTNAGDEPLEQAFRNWHWSRASDEHGTTVLYDLVPRDGDPRGLAVRFDRRTGQPGMVEAAHGVDLPRTLWRIDRRTRADNPGAARVVKTLEDTPFYARSLIRTHIDGADVTAVHETLSLERFAHPLVQLMLPFRMPRRRR